MTAASNYAENDILNTLLGTAANRYVKLHTGDPGEDCNANESTEDTREAIQFAAASGGSKPANSLPTWTTIGVSGQESLQWISIWDTVGPTGGNPLVKLQLSANRTVDPGDDFELTAVTVTCDLR